MKWLLFIFFFSTVAYSRSEKKTIETLQQFVKDELLRAGGKAVFKNKKESIECFNGSASCNGVYDSISKELTVWTSPGEERRWVPILLHEYAHFRQDQLLSKEELREHQHKIRQFNHWLGRQIQLSYLQKSQLIADKMLHEQKAEEFAYEFMVQLPLFDKDFHQRFIQVSNAYIFFYRYVEKYRRFYKKGQEPFWNDRIVEKMPKKFFANPYQEAGKYLHVFEQELGRK